MACCLLDVVFNLSVEIVAGSLMSGVVSLSHVLQPTVFCGAAVVSFGVQNRLTCHLAFLLRPVWHLVGPSSDSGRLGNTRRETLGFQAWSSVDSGGIWGLAFGSFWQTLQHKLCFLA